MSKSKAKGTAFESLVVVGFQTAGWPHVERRALRGVHDGGDIAGIPGVAISCKNEARLDLAGWLKELNVQVKNAHADLGFVAHKRRLHMNPEDQYATTDLATMFRLLHEAGR